MSTATTSPTWQKTSLRLLMKAFISSLPKSMTSNKKMRFPVVQRLAAVNLVSEMETDFTEVKRKRKRSARTSPGTTPKPSTSKQFSSIRMSPRSVIMNGERQPSLANVKQLPIPKLKSSEDCLHQSSSKASAHGQPFSRPCPKPTSAQKTVALKTTRYASKQRIPTALVKLLDDRALKYFTFRLPEEKPIQCVIRGLHRHFKADEIKSELEQ